MNEKLLHDFWLESNLYTFPDFEIEIQTVTDGVIEFREQEPWTFGSFVTQKVDLLDVLAWVYSKIN